MCLLQDKMNEDLRALTDKLKTRLAKYIGDENAGAFLTTISSTGELASLGPLMGLTKLQSGTLSRDDYLRDYGHRGPRENELAEPRAYENPEWLDVQLAGLARSPIDVNAMSARRDAQFETAWDSVTKELPTSEAHDIAHIVTAYRETNRRRETTRSELTRVVGVIRALFLRAGQLTRLGDGVFYLTIGELLEVLSGGPSVADRIPKRRDAYRAYRALPALPTWIRGRFDPFEWANDPERRGDVYDATHSLTANAPSNDRILRGHPGSAGRTEGMVRRIDVPEEGDQLAPGEILVTGTTNVGWTPLFPRAAAVVTDIGGALSHAAIVARELGIPAVVGCHDATTRLKTGDHVRVDGGQGTIEILERVRGRDL
jgi:pyruvate,water dikinase